MMMEWIFYVILSSLAFLISNSIPIAILLLFVFVLSQILFEYLEKQRAIL